MLRILGIGDNVCDKYVHQKTMYPGGQAVNVCVYSTMLGAEAAYIGVFGTDDVARHVIDALDAYGIDRRHCSQYPGENGCARVGLMDGDRVFLGSNRGGVLKDHPIALTQAQLDYAATFHLIHTSNNSYLDGQLPKLSALGVPISYDFSGQWTDEERVSRVAPYITYAFLSCGDLSQDETQQLCRTLHQKGVKLVVATRGSHGALIFDGTDFYNQSPQFVVAIDTLGAGDSFAAAFLLSLLSQQHDNPTISTDHTRFTQALSRAAQQGAEFSAKTCLVHGAFGRGVPYEEPVPAL